MAASNTILASYASLVPKQRALYPEGVKTILALIGLGATGSVKEAALRLFGSIDGMKVFLQAIQDLNTHPEIQSESGIFFSDRDRFMKQTYFEAVKNLASVFRLNFEDSAAVVQLNKWIQHRSGFANFFTEDDIQGMSVILMNTLWFKDSWVHQFDPEMTRPQPFYRGDGTEISIPTMGLGEKSIRFFQDATTTAVQLPFQNGSRLEVIMGPAADYGFPNGRELPYDVSPTGLILDLPRFTIQESINLIPLAKSLGFEGIFKDGGLDDILPHAVIGLFEQRIFFEIKEEGAEVRAVTHASVFSFAAPVRVDPVRLQFNRPFHFFITSKSGADLIAGYFDATTI